MPNVNFTEEVSAKFEPALTAEQVESLEQSAKDRGQQRRLALLACATSSDKLRELRDNEPEAFLDMLNAVEAFKNHAQGLAEIAEAALCRMLLAGTTEAKH